MMKPLTKKKGGVITDLISGTGGLVIMVVIILVIVSTILTANLLGAGDENTTAYGLSANLTDGIQNVSEKIPTILLIAAVVLLFGVLVLLVTQARRAGFMGGGAGSL
jgi:hypothetical protein